MFFISPQPQLAQLVTVAPAALYGFSRLNAGYSGPFVKVRRDSDNTEKDCYSRADISAFCSGANGFASKLYDQSKQASPIDFPQTTTAQQPKLYDASTGLVLDGTNLAATFDGTVVTLNPTGAGPFGGDPAMTIAHLHKNTDSGANNRCIYHTGQRTNTTGDFVATFMNGSDGKVRMLSQNLNIEWTPVASLTALQYWVFRKPASSLLSTATMRVNGTNLSQSALTDGNLNIVNNSGSEQILGAERGLAGPKANFFQGNIHILALWTSVLSSQDVANLEAFFESKRVT